MKGKSLTAGVSRLNVIMFIAAQLVKVLGHTTSS